MKPTPSRRNLTYVFALMCVAVWQCVLSNRAAAQDAGTTFRIDFEGGDGQSKYRGPDPAVLIQHQLAPAAKHAGATGERLVFESAEESTQEHRITFAVPNARVFDELTARIWMRSTVRSVQMGMRICFPHHLDPRTGAPLRVDFVAPPVTQELKEWRQLECRTKDDALRSVMIRVREQLSVASGVAVIDDRAPYVEEVFLQLQLPEGYSALDVDELEFGPVVTASDVVRPPTSIKRDAVSRLTIQHDRIRKDGQPFLPIFAPYHGESIDEMARTGFNMLWVPDYQDAPVVTAISQEGIGIIARPPQSNAEDTVLDRAAFTPLSDDTSAVWAWMLGVMIPHEEHVYVSRWADQVRDADRQLKRPILADVRGRERDFHRHIDLLASSRFGLHTSLATPDHFEQLRRRQVFALPGKPLFVFLQTEPADAWLDYRGDQETMPIVEPEQILQQGYEALAAGFKGIGFWKRIPFDTRSSGLDERMLAIRIFSLHCGILERWLATARTPDDLEVQVGQPGASANPLASRWDRKVDPVSHTTSVAPAIRARLVQTDYGLMILMGWYEDGGQCVPGPQTAQDVRVLVRGDYAQAYEVTPTSVDTSNLDWARVAGGTEFRLKNFDQNCIIIIPHRNDELDLIRKKTRSVRETAAAAYVELASAKLQRVTATHETLVKLATPPVSHAEATLQSSSRLIDQARESLQAGRSDDARISSQQALQRLRDLQRRHWRAAVDPMGSATASIDASSFQTLPDHWRLMAELGPERGLSQNLLPSGSFEDEAGLQGWINGGGDLSRYQLHPGGPQGASHLSITLDPNAPPDHVAAIISPEVAVNAGDLVVITGQVQIPRVPGRRPPEFLAYDTLLGRTGALRFGDEAANWTSFRLLRRAKSATALRVRFELCEAGAVRLDDIRVRVISSAAP